MGHGRNNYATGMVVHPCPLSQSRLRIGNRQVPRILLLLDGWHWRFNFYLGNLLLGVFLAPGLFVCLFNLLLLLSLFGRLSFPLFLGQSLFLVFFCLEDPVFGQPDPHHQASSPLRDPELSGCRSHRSLFDLNQPDKFQPFLSYRKFTFRL